MSVSDSQGICPASAVLSVISELAERGDRPDPSLLDPQSPHPMSQHPGGHTHDERSSGWKSEEYLIPETQTEPDAESSRYHEMHVQEQPQTLGDLRSTRQTSYRTSDAPAADLAHYSDRTSYLGPVATVYLQPDSAGPAHLERAERSTQPSGRDHLPRLWEINWLIQVPDYKCRFSLPFPSASALPASVR